MGRHHELISGTGAFAKLVMEELAADASFVTVPDMKLISINVSLPREVEILGKPVLTGIYKQPISGPVRLRQLNLEGDGQADLKVHGGPS